MIDKDEVIKSLELYIELMQGAGLKDSRQEKTARDAIDLIKSQDAEIERLKEMVGDGNDYQ